MRLLEKVVKLLAEGKPLPVKYQDHSLSGDYKGCRECHIIPDWLLVYEIIGNGLILQLTRTGTHSGIFGRNAQLAIFGGCAFGCAPYGARF